MKNTLAALAAVAAMTFAVSASAEQIDGTKITTSSQSLPVIAGLGAGATVAVVVVVVGVIAAVADAIDDAPSGT